MDTNRTAECRERTDNELLLPPGEALVNGAADAFNETAAHGTLADTELDAVIGGIGIQREATKHPAKVSV
jgi:hypothetical protein